MRFRAIGIAWALVLVCCICVVPARAETWRLAVIEDWPPYADRSLGDNSIAIKALKEILDVMNVQLEVVFMPWARAKYAVMTDQRFVGFYCAWPGDIEDTMIQSEPVLYSPIAIVSNVRQPVTWQDRESFDQLRMVKVRHYEYPKVFMELHKAMFVSNPASLLKAVASGRADFGVIDRNVMAHLLKNDTSLEPYRYRLRLDQEDVVSLPLTIGFADNPLNRRRNARLSAAMHRMHLEGQRPLGQ